MYIPVETPGGIIWAKIEENQGTIISAFQNRAFDSFEDVSVALADNAGYLKSAFEALAPHRMEISFGITAGLSPGPDNAPIFALGRGPTNYSVNLVWEKEDDAS